MKNISFKAVLIGFIALLIIDSVGDMLLTFIMSGTISAEVSRELWTTTSFLIWRTIVAILALAAAGHIAARIAASAYFLNSGIVGTLALIVTILVYGETWPLWFGISAISTQIPGCLLGALVLNKFSDATGR